MKELHQDIIDQIRNHLFYLKQTDLMQNKDILMCLDVVAREYGGEVVDKIKYLICCFYIKFRLE